MILVFRLRVLGFLQGTLCVGPDGDGRWPQAWVRVPSLPWGRAWEMGK